MAMTFAAYAAPADGRPRRRDRRRRPRGRELPGRDPDGAGDPHPRGVLLLGLAVVVAVGFGAAPAASPAPLPDATVYGVLQGAGLLFFAFAGYARIATMGEEVVDPARTIPRAIVLALGGAVVVYALVGLVVLLVLGGDARGAAAPLADILTAAGWSAFAPWCGSLRRPPPSARCSPCSPASAARRSPWRGKAISPGPRPYRRPAPGAAPCRDHPRRHRDRAGARGRPPGGDRVLVLRRAAVLPHRERRRVPPAGAARRYPRMLQVGGALGCLALVSTLPVLASLLGTGVVLLGIAGRALRMRWPQRGRP